MRALFLAAGAALTLSACGGGGETTEANDANATADSMMMDQNASMNMDANMDANMDMNATDPAAQNLGANDLNAGATDANATNGM